MESPYRKASVSEDIAVETGVSISPNGIGRHLQAALVVLLVNVSALLSSFATFWLLAPKFRRSLLAWSDPQDRGRSGQ
jgi:hypothetical protein